MSEPRTHIVAMGGGGFSMEDEPFLDDFVLSLARAARPRVCFLPTASGDSATYLVRFYRAFAQRDCRAVDLTLFDVGPLGRRPPDSAGIADFLLQQDVIYVGGGNTASMLALWRAHGVDGALRRAHEAGVVLAGLSAGMICWFEAGITDSFGTLAPLRDGLGILGGSACPHYDGEEQRRAAFHEAIRGGLPDGHAADDGAALHFVNGQLAEVVASRPAASGYRVVSRGGEVVEERLEARFLGATGGPRIAPVLTDGTVILDAPELADVEAMMAGEDEEQARRFGWHPGRSSPETVQTAIRDWRAEWLTGGLRRGFMIRTRDGVLVGGCELRPAAQGLAHASYWIFPQHRRRSFASRALRLATDYAFSAMGVERLELHVEPDNLASLAVARRAGFVEEGVMRMREQVGAARRDMVLLARLKSD